MATVAGRDPVILRTVTFHLCQSLNTILSPDPQLLVVISSDGCISMDHWSILSQFPPVHALCLMYIAIVTSLAFSNNRLSLHSTSLEPEKAIHSDKKFFGPIRRIHAGGAAQEGTY